MKEFKKLTPFKLQVLENFPFIDEDFDAITNYELLCKVVEYLNKTIGEVSELDNKVNEFQNYFDNLDVQEEINNKLDKMAESGQLTDIIAQYLNLAGVLAFNTLNDLKSATNIANGSTTRILGKVTYNDGLGAYYKIRTLINTDVIDNDNLVALTNYPTLVAEKIPVTRLNNIERTLSLMNNKKFLIIGDSYAEGYSPDETLTSFPYLFKQHLNLTDDQITIAYQGGIGFAREGYLIRTLINTLNNDNDITDIYILSGYNDRGQSYENIRNEIQLCNNLLKTKFPNGILHIGEVGCSNNPDNVYPLYLINTYYKKACNELNIKFIDNINYALHEYFLSFSSDGFHPNQYGQNLLSLALESYVCNGYLNISSYYMDVNISLEDGYSTADTISTILVSHYTNDITYLQSKRYITLSCNNKEFSGANVKYKIGTLTGGCLIGNNSYELNTICVPIIIKSNNLYYKTTGNIYIHNKGIYLGLFQINGTGSNFEYYTNVTEILIDQFSASFSSDLI